MSEPARAVPARKFTIETDGLDWRLREQVPLPATLVAAKHAFYERGYHGTSIRDIASRAGVSLPTLYYHHDNKLGILVELLEAAMTAVLAWVGAAIESGRTPSEQLSNAIESIVLHMTNDVELASVASEFRHLDVEDPRRETYVAMRTETEELLASVIERGVESGEFHFDDDVKDVLRYLFGACQAITTWYRPSGARTPAEVAASYALLSLRVVGARDADQNDN
ncbi:TetR family transcriptional regulator [Gordonia sp. JH63]|uniref:TetR/AcrR family transcriptional regulator n=1 Tax=Gordonia hongkongensis TaxID=1701090 RepID=A0AAX3T880_9ACTN|nr:MULTISPECIES: TetR/AcrR family transcriptional regulator [Gordonia]OCW84557.1 TetR family transcriptional regulator [Nocardia farcinica]QIK49725.1 TetR/AcrR family transcriptional regulator [Gordonia terrae]MBN0971211.1 TetR family transcriptional regulator [Gordonia sp. BP-119]MBN0981831.1 TetR family transcriptional regulator [Gordonia sp. BP-94]MBR7191833.1 TetR family transcriptional regulator [Gordonia sp. SCSIO 19800]